MIKLTAVGVIYSISPVVNVGESNFQKRELVIDDSWIDREQQVHPNYIGIEFTGERMAMLDQFQPGQRVCIEAMVNGREYNGRYYTSLRGLTVTLPMAQQTQQQQYAAPQQAPAYPQQGFAQQGYQQPQQAFPQQCPSNQYPPQQGPGFNGPF
jgi:hypothetical protein